MLRFPLLPALLLACALPAQAHRLVEDYQPGHGLLRIGPEPHRAIPLTEIGHTLILPDGPASGTIVFVDARRFDSSGFAPEPGTVEGEALPRGLAVLHVTTGNPLDFLFAADDVRRLVDRIAEVLTANDLASHPVHLAGLSLGGTRALRVAQHLAGRGEEASLRLGSVAVVDAPLDLERLWGAERRAAELGFHPAAADEGRWVTYLLEKNLGGPPSAAADAYRDASAYCDAAPDGGNAALLRDVPVRAYHEPDVDWWIEHRRKDYRSMNSIDLAGLVNRLRILGNDRAELVTTHRQRDGWEDDASPHTWSFVDNVELVEWFLGS